MTTLVCNTLLSVVIKPTPCCINGYDWFLVIFGVWKQCQPDLLSKFRCTDLSRFSQAT